MLTTTGAARTLVEVLPAMEQIGFIAESVRVPTTAGSLVMLVVNLQERINADPTGREEINALYAEFAADASHPWLQVDDRQNVSFDIVGHPPAAAVIESHVTHTRTAEVRIDLANVPALDQYQEALAALPLRAVRVPVTQAVVYGWYDNELGSYAHMLVERALTVAQWL